MKVSSVQTALCEVALKDATVRHVFTCVVDVFDSLPVPIYADKSSKQGTLDLAHSMLNVAADEWFHGVLGWYRQCTLAAVTAGASDERKSLDFVYSLPDGRKIALEVQFGNSGRIQADFAKFRTLHEQGTLALAIVVYLERATAETADSGLATFEAGKRELDKLSDMPVVILGLSREGCPEVDLRDVRGIVHPSVLGGSGKGRLVVQSAIAKAIINGQPLSELVLDNASRKVIHDHTIEQAYKDIAALRANFERVAACDDPVLKAKAGGIYLDFSRSTYMTPEDRVRAINETVAVTVKEELARERERIRAQREKKQAKAKLAKAEKKKLDKERAKADALAAKAIAKAADKQPKEPAAEASSLEVSVAAPAADNVVQLPVKRVIRVTKADEDARLAREAQARIRPVDPAPTALPTWNAMGLAMADAVKRGRG